MDSSYYTTYNPYSTVPTAYGSDASFAVADLGNYGQYDTQSMQRTTSRYSASSYDSALPLDGMSPVVSDSAFDYTTEMGFYDNNQMQPAYATTAMTGSYRLNTMQPGVSNNTSGYQETMMGSSTMQPSSVPTEKPAEWRCLAPGCPQKPFKRCADLVRHMERLHNPESSADYFCDYKKCSRSNESFQEARERAGGNLSPTTTGIGAFHRKDHFKAHLRDFHKEPIPKRNSKEGSSFSDACIFHESWWRCSKCLKKNSSRKNGYTCGECNTPLEQEVISERRRRFGTARHQ